MGKYDKLIYRILRGNADENIAFEDLCALLRRFEFEERIRGSHHIFRKTDVEERVNLQRDGSKAKSYQVRQIRTILLKYKLVGDE